MGSVVIGHVRLSLLIMGPIGALAMIGCLIILLVFLEIDWKVSLWVRMTPVEPFINQTARSTAMVKNLNAQYMSIIRYEAY